MEMARRTVCKWATDAYAIAAHCGMVAATFSVTQPEDASCQQPVLMSDMNIDDPSGAHWLAFRITLRRSLDRRNVELSNRAGWRLTGEYTHVTSEICE